MNTEIIPLIDGVPAIRGSGAKMEFYISGKINKDEPGKGYYISNRQFTAELAYFGYDVKQYYDEFVLKGIIPTCTEPSCSNPVTFQSFRLGYRKYCCTSCGSIHAWKLDDGSRHEAQAKLGRELMTDMNEWIWDHPDYKEYMEERNKRLSERMTQFNLENWKDPEYREERSKYMSEWMSNPENKSNLDYYRFVNYYEFGIFYIIINKDNFKIGISSYDVENDNKVSHMWSKLSKYGTKDSIVKIWHGTAVEVADLEYELKISYKAIEGHLEIFPIELLDEILNKIENSKLTTVEYEC